MTQSMPYFSSYFKEVSDKNRKRAGTSMYYQNFLLKVDGVAYSFNELAEKMELDEEQTQRLRMKIKTLRSQKGTITMAKLLTVKGN